MKVLFYTDTPNYGGAERQMAILAKYLKKLNVEVYLACSSYSKLSKKNEENKIYKKVFIINSLHKHDPSQYFKLKKILKNENFDLIHIHLWNPASCRYAFLSAKHSKLKIVTTEHDPFKLSSLKLLIKRYLNSFTDAIIAISSSNLREIELYDKSIKNRLQLIHNAIDLKEFLKKYKKVDLNISKENFIITCVAELHERKGHKYLFEAFSNLKKEMSNLSLCLIGDGPLKNKLKEEAEKIGDIHFLYWRNDVVNILRQSNLFVLPSIREAFGLSILEAMACLVPVISSENEGAKDIIKDNFNGILFKLASSEDLKNKIVSLIKNKKKIDFIVKNGEKTVREKFTAEKMAERTFNLYKSLL